MGQRDDVVRAMRENGGYATFSTLNHCVDFSAWGTKTPEASVRRIVQQAPDTFFKIQPGLWALEECRANVLKKLDLNAPSTENAPNDEKVAAFTHAYYQGLLVELGNWNHFQTYVPPQDKNKKFLEKPLCEICTIPQLKPFSFEPIVRFAKTVDVIWLNERDMPSALFEVEHTTDIEHSMVKFHELQDFNSRFFIVADQNRKRQFDDIYSRSIFSKMRNKIQFLSYEELSNRHSALKKFDPDSRLNLFGP